MKRETWRKTEALAARRLWTLNGRPRCASYGCEEPGREAHHPFGRTKEPWCSSRYVLVLLCGRHHREVTGQVGSGLNVELRDFLRLLALDRIRGKINEALYAKGRRHVVVWMDADDEGLPRRFDYVCEVADLNGIAPPFWRGGSGGRK